MPDDWMPQGQAVFAYKKPKQEGQFLIMRISEAPNGKLSVSFTDTSLSSPQEQENNLQSLIKMIEKHKNYSDLDSWLAKHEFIKQYKSEILSKIIDLPAEP